MKVAVIGDVHGTTKFLECYNSILKNGNDVSKIIVLGDWFDPYDDIPVEHMVELYREFKSCRKNDGRIVSLLGNHDLDGYIISGYTNRTEFDPTWRKRIREELMENVPESYLVYRIGNWLFSHAGVSRTWMSDISEMDPSYPELMLSNRKGWTPEELDILCRYYDGDFSGYGNNPHQGCTWIRPYALVKDMFDYNQVIGHSQVENIVNVKTELGLKNDLWMIDNQRNPEYLTLEIEDAR